MSQIPSLSALDRAEKSATTAARTPDRASTATSRAEGGVARLRSVIAATERETATASSGEPLTSQAAMLA